MMVRREVARLRTKAQLVREIRRILNGAWPHPKDSRLGRFLPAWWVARQYAWNDLVAVLDDIGVDCAELWDHR